mmetsp:Transcript_4801/g.9823  ORF Transcript_4801/g.9823 Transcript_4801/m.9823 type:complete len:221 (+) Transcript_4801:105-767(+)
MMFSTTLSPDDIPFPHEFSPIVTTKRMPKRKNVSFFPKVFVHRVIRRRDFTTTELRRTWYSMDELKAMRMAAIQLSKTVTNGGNHTDCLRGLEGKTKESLRKRRMIKSTAKKAVFLEQCRQWNCGIVDSNLMADEYFEYTESSSSAAYMIAIRDQKEAMNIHNQEATIMTTPTKFTVDVGSRRKSIAMYAQSDSMRSMKSLTSFASTSARRLISDVMFQV